MLSLFRKGKRRGESTQMLYQNLKGIDTLKQFVERDDIKEMLFAKDETTANYYFNYYSSKYKVALQLDTYSNYDTSFNMEGIKVFTIPSLNISVLKISDYQLLTDLDEVARKLRTFKTQLN